MPFLVFTSETGPAVTLTMSQAIDENAIRCLNSKHVRLILNKQKRKKNILVVMTLNVQQRAVKTNKWIVILFGK